MRHVLKRAIFWESPEIKELWGFGPPRARTRCMWCRSALLLAPARPPFEPAPAAHVRVPMGRFRTEAAPVFCRRITASFVCLLSCSRGAAGAGLESLGPAESSHTSMPSRGVKNVFFRIFFSSRIQTETRDFLAVAVVAYFAYFGPSFRIGGGRGKLTAI